MRCSTCSTDISITRVCVSLRREPIVWYALASNEGKLACSSGQALFDHDSATQSTAATAVAG